MSKQNHILNLLICKYAEEPSQKETVTSDVKRSSNTNNKKSKNARKDVPKSIVKMLPKLPEGELIRIMDDKIRLRDEMGNEALKKFPDAGSTEKALKILKEEASKNKNSKIELNSILQKGTENIKDYNTARDKRALPIVLGGTVGYVLGEKVVAPLIFSNDDDENDLRKRKLLGLLGMTGGALTASAIQNN